MNFDLTAIPVTIDLLHASLGAIALVFLVLFLIRSRNKRPAVMDNRADQPESPAASAPVAETITPSQLKTTSPDAALQLLALLQQEARFIDFIQEDLLGFSDADVGAAARVVHEGGKKVMNDYFSLAAVRDEQEESRITLAGRLRRDSSSPYRQCDRAGAFYRHADTPWLESHRSQAAEAGRRP